MEIKLITGKPSINNFGVSALSQAVQIADIPWCGHRFTPTHHFLHPAAPVCVDLQRARGVLQRKRALTTGTRKLEKAPWASCWVLPQLFHTPLETEGHIQPPPPSPPQSLARPASGPHSQGSHATKNPHHPTGRCQYQPFDGKPKAGVFVFRRSAEALGGIEYGDFAEPRIRTRCLTAGLIRLDVNLRLSQEIPGVPAGSRDVS